MKKLRPRLTFANVVSCLALFVALGGSAYAATQLKKNSVGTKQLKNNAVTSAKIKKGAVTGAKVDLSSLGTVPSASNAAHANNADTATVATKANALLAPEAAHFVGQPGEPPFENGAVNLASTGRARFWKDRQCVVHLAGTIKAKNGQAIFTLPAADIPEEEEVFTAIPGNLANAADLEVLSKGEVVAFTHTTGEVTFGLDGVNFRAATC